MSEWIKIEDKLPENGVDVLVYVGMPVAPSGEMDIGVLDEDGWRVRHWKSSNVTHWMPMPDEPEAES